MNIWYKGNMGLYRYIVIPIVEENGTQFLVLLNDPFQMAEFYSIYSHGGDLITTLLYSLGGPKATESDVVGVE